MNLRSVAALALAATSLLSGAAAARLPKHPAAKGMTAKEKGAAEARAKWIVAQGKKMLYGGGAVTTFDGMITITGDLNIVPGNLPDGTAFSVDETHYGVEVSEGVVRLKSGPARDFVLAHEYGHLFTEKALKGMAMPGIGGKGTEVVADLISAYLLVGAWTAGGPMTKRKLLENTLVAALKHEKANIFGGESGDHPSGDKRIAYIEELFKGLDAKLSLASFNTAAAAILKKV